MKAAAGGIIVLTALIFVLSNCASAPKVKDGDTVKVHYVGRLEDGTVFDSSTAAQPLEFVVGSGSMIQGFDKGVVGMAVGESKTITLSPEDAYGNSREDRIMEVDRKQLPPDLNLIVGMELSGPGGFPVKVKAIADSSVTIDANHPLAGKTLVFDLKIVEVTAGGGTNP